MKQIPLTIIAAALLLFVAAAFPQNEQQKVTEPRQTQHVTEMMKDSSMVSMLMDSIAANSRLRVLMVQKMLSHAKTDSAGMRSMSRMITDDQEMHAPLTKSMAEQKHDTHGTAQEILIKFNPGVQAAQVSALESEVGLRQIKAIAALDVRVYEITSSKSVKEVIALCQKKSFVKYAEPNQQYKTLKN